MQSASAVDVTLIVPGLLGPGALGSAGSGAIDPGAADALVAGIDIDGLDRLLSRARLTSTTDADGTFESLAFQSFGYENPSAGADWPVAAFTALIDRDPGERSALLRADPVHLRPDVADLVLFDPADAEIPTDEAGSLADIVNSALGPDGPLVHAAHPDRWYVALDAPARIATTPLSLATGGPVSPAMPRGRDAPRWHRWMNEVQMALHECPVNERRERRGAAPINSLWPWGGGSLPGAAETTLVGAWSDDVLVHGLALHAGVESGAMPVGADAWLDGDPRSGPHLFAWGGLHRAARRLDLEAWRDALAQFSDSWAEPLLDGLDRGTVSRVSILDDRGHRFGATRRGLFQLRRRGGLAERIAAAGRTDRARSG